MVALSDFGFGSSALHTAKGKNIANINQPSDESTRLAVTDLVRSMRRNVFWKSFMESSVSRMGESSAVRVSGLGCLWVLRHRLRGTKQDCRMGKSFCRAAVRAYSRPEPK